MALPQKSSLILTRLQPGARPGCIEKPFQRFPCCFAALSTGPKPGENERTFDVKLIDILIHNYHTALPPEFLAAAEP
jgi:hypothetical protein